MNILFSHPSGVELTETREILQVLRRCGHQVFAVTSPHAQQDLARGEWIAPGFALDTPLKALEWAAGFKPDLFLYVEPLGLIPTGLERAEYPTACWLCDTHRALQPRRRLARFFDHVFLYQRAYLPAFDEHPVGYVHWLPFACDLEMFHPVGGERDLDVAFIGQFSPGSGRSEIWQALAGKYRVNEARFYQKEEIAKIYSRAKIVLNLPVGDDLNFRTFEALSCGALLLTRRQEDGLDQLLEEGVHYAAYGSQAEMIEKIDYYLAYPAERERVANEGLQAVRAQHRMEQRIESLLTTVTGNPNLAAPLRSMTGAAVDREYAWLYELWGSADAGLALARRARQDGRAWLLLLHAVGRTILRNLRSLISDF